MKKQISSVQSVYKFSIGILIGIILAGCNINTALKGVPPEDEDSAPAEDGEESLYIPPKPDLPDSLADEEDYIGETGSPRGACPAAGEDFFLIYDHHFAVGAPEEALTYAAYGAEPITFDRDGNVMGDFLTNILGYVEVSIDSPGGSCYGGADAEIVTMIEGHCSNGTLEMSIVEDWQFEMVNLICDEDVVQFPFPGSGTFQHTNLIFTIMEKGGSFVVKYPFFGGEGAKTWTLTDTVPLAPIVPPDELEPPSLQGTGED